MTHTPLHPSNTPTFAPTARLALSLVTSVAIAMSPILAHAAKSPMADDRSTASDTDPTTSPTGPTDPLSPPPSTTASNTSNTPATGPEVAAQGPMPQPAQPSDHYRERKGLGGLVSGSILLGLGLPQVIAGAVIVTRAADNELNTVENTVQTGVSMLAGAALLTVGSVLSMVGTPLLAVGSVRYARYRRWQRDHQASLQPTLMTAGTTRTYGAGVGFRF